MAENQSCACDGDGSCSVLQVGWIQPSTMAKERSCAHLDTIYRLVPNHHRSVGA